MRSMKEDFRTGVTRGHDGSTPCSLLGDEKVRVEVASALLHYAYY